MHWKTAWKGWPPNDCDDQVLRLFEAPEWGRCPRRYAPPRGIFEHEKMGTFPNNERRLA